MVEATKLCQKVIVTRCGVSSVDREQLIEIMHRMTLNVRGIRDPIIFPQRLRWRGRNRGRLKRVCRSREGLRLHRIAFYQEAGKDPCWVVRIRYREFPAVIYSIMSAGERPKETLLGTSGVRIQLICSPCGLYTAMPGFASSRTAT